MLLLLGRLHGPNLRIVSRVNSLALSLSPASARQYRNPPMLFRRLMSTAGSFETLIVSKPTVGVRLIQLNRPKALNAINPTLITELLEALAQAERDPEIGAVVLTGNDKAFAAGADIKAMKDFSFGKAFREDFIGRWSNVGRTRKPLIAAVNGYALGGGCEMAMMADIIYAGENAVFGQPEIKLGVIPGAGGTQRLTRAIGKSRAMELILTGNNFSAQQASDWGLVSKVVPTAETVDTAVKLAATIAEQPPVAVQAAVESVNQAYESSLTSGLLFERNVFYGLFGTNDQNEGMTAFIEKRKPEWTGD